MSEPGSDLLHKALFGFYALFVFSSTFSIAISQSSLGLALILFIVVLIKERHQPFVRRLRWFYIFIGLFIVWLLVTSAMAEKPLASMKNTKEEWLFFVIPIGIYLFQFEKYRRLLITIFASGVALVALYGIAQKITGTNWFKSDTLNVTVGGAVRVSGNFSHPLTFGNYFATAALFFVGYAVSKFRKPRSLRDWLILIAPALSMVAVVFTYSRGAMAAMLAGLLALGFCFKRKYLVYVAVVVVIIVATLLSLPNFHERYTQNLLKDFNYKNEESRVFIWSHALEVIADHPLFGIGQGGFGRAYKEYLRPDIPWWRVYPHAHNDFLQVAAISGIPGLIFFGGIWAVALGLFWKNFRSELISEEDRRLALAALLGSVVFLVSSLSECTFGDEEVRQMLMFVWAAGLSVTYKYG
jgi:putative inorganic carbon (HCO3(-)) transporter